MNYDIVYYKSRPGQFKIVETVTVGEELLPDYIESLQHTGNTIFAIFSKN